MAYSAEVFGAAMAKLEKHRQDAAEENKLVKSRLYGKLPRLSEIEQELASTGLTAARAVLAGGGKEAISDLKRQNLELQAERVEILVKNGYPPDILVVNYHCTECNDTGYVGDIMCSCLRRLLREEACKAANAGSPLPLFTFDTFDLSYYSEEVIKEFGMSTRAHMEKVYNHCVKYARDFGKNRSGLLLLGKTGLGKTHLALSIANAVIEQGFGVIYDTAQNILGRMEEEYFGRMEKLYTRSVFDCDLLVLDELPDYANAFSVNTLYNIINTRTLSHRPMIVSTNLTESEIASRYGERIFSRLIGEFRLLKFYGSDIRQLKLRRGVS